MPLVHLVVDVRILYTQSLTFIFLGQQPNAIASVVAVDVRTILDGLAARGVDPGEVTVKGEAVGIQRDGFADAPLSVFSGELLGRGEALPPCSWYIVLRGGGSLFEHAPHLDLLNLALVERTCRSR